MTRVLALLLMLVVLQPAGARGRYAKGGGWQASIGPVYRAVPNTAVDAMAELNARRAGYGLPPFQTDPQLLQAAMNAASCRASLRHAGHLQNDYAALPAGVPGYPSCVAGCGVYDGMFLSCGSDDRKRFAGAAKARGADGRWYCHLFVKQ